jgi:hypothetical protein
MTGQRAHWFGIATLVAMLTACGGSTDFVDTDGTAKTALGLPTELTVEGKLDVGIGDSIDWKRFTAEKDGTASLAVRVGDPFVGHHSVAGTIVVFDRDANQVTSEAITHNMVKYQLSWDVVKDTQYLVRMMANEGHATYAMDLTLDFGEADPCDDITCAEGETCEDGQCIDPFACEPACSRGEVCVDGECERKSGPARAKPCGGKKCPRGQYCSTRKDRCVKDPCHGKRCGSGEVCRRGVCKPKPAPKPKPATKSSSSSECDPSCAKCVKGKCKYGPLSARVVQSVARGDQTTITLNKGSAHKVKKGQGGKVAGVGSFRIIEVYEVRSKAILKAPLSKLGAKKSATIYR